MLDGQRPSPALRGVLRDPSRADLFLAELRTVLLSCGRVLISDSFLAYAAFTVKERDAIPKIGQTFYESGLAAFQQLIRTFLAEAETQGVVMLEDAEGAAWTILSLICGCSLLRGILTGGTIPDAELVANVDNAVDLFADCLSRA